MSRKLIRGGYVSSMDPAVGDHPVGDVLVQDNLIAAVGQGIDAPGAEVIDATGMVVMPVDTHGTSGRARSPRSPQTGR
jgi:cytosine/adenosine deaminase-related metal-dependent hydrolase